MFKLHFWTNENATFDTIKARKLSCVLSLSVLCCSAILWQIVHYCHLFHNTGFKHLLILCKFLKESTLGVQRSIFYYSLCHFFNEYSNHVALRLLFHLSSLISSIMDFNLEKHAFCSTRHTSHYYLFFEPNFRTNWRFSKTANHTSMHIPDILLYSLDNMNHKNMTGCSFVSGKKKSFYSTGWKSNIIQQHTMRV